MSTRNLGGRLLLGLALLGGASLATSGCADDLDAAQASASGMLELRLATTQEGKTYRLTRCALEIRGLVNMVMRPGDRPEEAMRTELPVGDYQMQLLDGWVLQKVDDKGQVQPVQDVKLLSDNPVKFKIQDAQTTNVGFSFEVDGTVVVFPIGSVAVDVSVKQGQGCTAEDDRDKDGIPDCHDECPDDPAKWRPLSCGCGQPEVDSDLNGVTDCLERDNNCDDPNADTDQDGVKDCQDNCPFTANPDQADTDEDGLGDLCPRGIQRSISTGGIHTCAIRKGRVFCWGVARNMLLGDGKSFGQTNVVQEPTGRFRDAVSISAGAEHSCALLANGRARCWGAGYYGQLGAPFKSASRPRPVIGLMDAVAIAVGVEFSCALHRDGTVSCWGRGDQLGINTEEKSASPVKVEGLRDIVHITANRGATCALQQGGTTYCWGGGYKQVGRVRPNGPNSGVLDIPVPARSNLLPKLTQIELSGWGIGCGIRASDRQVVCWGGGSLTYLGNGEKGSSLTPVEVLGAKPAVMLADGGESHRCAVLEGGKVICWGFGALGVPTESITSSTTISAMPLMVHNMETAKEVVVGEAHSCAALESGEFQCWGNGGQLGFRSKTNISARAVPDEYVTFPENYQLDE